jgi:ABC-type glycerol-3-phosphate transport system permease component
MHAIDFWDAGVNRSMFASTIATLPIACPFIFLQRYFIKGLTAAAVKG